MGISACQELEVRLKPHREFFREIAAFIAANSEYFRIVGEGFDRDYTERDPTGRGRSLMYERFLRAADDLAQTPENLHIELPDKQRAWADRVLLMTWLMTDPGAHQQKPKLCSVQEYGWNLLNLPDGNFNLPLLRKPPEHADDPADYYDRVMDRYILRVAVFRSRYPRWVDWAKDAWEIVQQEIGSAKESNAPAPQDGIAAVTAAAVEAARLSPSELLEVVTRWYEDIQAVGEVSMHGLRGLQARVEDRRHEWARTFEQTELVAMAAREYGLDPEPVRRLGRWGESWVRKELPRWLQSGRERPSLVFMELSFHGMPVVRQLAEQLTIEASQTPARGDRAGKEESELDSRGRMSWQDAMERAEQHVKAHGGAIPSKKCLSDIIGCSRSTISKAIERSPYLLARYAERCARSGVAREVPLSDVILETHATSDEERLQDLIAEQEADTRRDERQWWAEQTRRR